MKMPIQKLDANLSEWQYPFFHLEQHEPVLPVLTSTIRKAVRRSKQTNKEEPRSNKEVTHTRIMADSGC